MKSVGIITICKCNNYGAELQAFATQKKIEQMGYNSELINYIYYKSWNFHDTKMSCPLRRMGLKDKMMYWLKYRFVNFVLEKLWVHFDIATRIRTERFNEFHEKNSKFSKPYYSMDALYLSDIKYDKYVIGSDQVWNPSASSNIEPYFLTFAPCSSKKISYASSFGVSELDESYKEKYKKWLTSLDMISVRENAGKKLVSNLCGKETEVVIDPTLLLGKSEWEKVAVPYENVPSRYVLVYDLAYSGTLYKLAKEVAKKLGISVCRICKRSFKMNEIPGICNILDAGPAEFLSLVENAECVITNSFHGTAFAINFNVPFYSVLDREKKNNSRIIDLLNLLGLSDRIVWNNEIPENLCVDIDYVDVEHELSKLKKESVEYLVRALS